LTVLTLDHDGRTFRAEVFVLPEQFAAWSYPATLEMMPLGTACDIRTEVILPTRYSPGVSRTSAGGKSQFSS
jgi:hypothetical protein